jgi:chromosome segregation ATPase
MEDFINETKHEIETHIPSPIATPGTKSVGGELTPNPTTTTTTTTTTDGGNGNGRPFANVRAGRVSLTSTPIRSTLGVRLMMSTWRLNHSHHTIESLRRTIDELNLVHAEDLKIAAQAAVALEEATQKRAQEEQQRRTKTTLLAMADARRREDEKKHSGMLDLLTKEHAARERQQQSKIGELRSQLTSLQTLLASADANLTDLRLDASMPASSSSALTTPLRSVPKASPRRVTSSSALSTPAPMTPSYSTSPKLGPLASPVRRSSGADMQQALAIAQEAQRAMKDAVTRREDALQQLSQMEAARATADRHQMELTQQLTQVTTALDIERARVTASELALRNNDERMMALDTQLNDARRRLIDSESAMATHQSTCSGTIDDLQQQVAQLRLELMSSQRRIIDLTPSPPSTERAMTDGSTSITTAVRLNGRMRRQLQRATTHRDHLQQQLNDLEAKMAHSDTAHDHERTTLINERDQLQKSCDDLTSQLTTQQSESTRLNTEASDLRVSCASLQSRLTEIDALHATSMIDMTSHDDTISALRARVTDLESQVAELRHLLTQAQHISAALRSSCREHAMTDGSASIIQARRSVAKLQRVVEANKDERASLLEQLAASDTRAMEAARERADLQHQLNALRESSRDALTASSQQTQLNKEMEQSMMIDRNDSIYKLEQRIASLDQELTASHQRLEQSMKDHHFALSHATAKASIAEAQRDECERRLADTNAKLVTLLHEFDAIRTTTINALTSSEAQLVERNGRITQLEQRLTSLNEELVSSTSRLEQSRNDYKLAVIDVAATKAAHTTSLQREHESELRLLNLQTQYDTLVNELETARTQSDDTLSSRDKTIDELEERIATLDHDLATTTSRLEQSMNDHNVAHSDATTLAEAATSVQHECNQRIAIADAQITELQHELNRIRVAAATNNDTSERDATIHILEQRILQQEAQLASMTHRLEQSTKAHDVAVHAATSASAAAAAAVHAAYDAMKAHPKIDYNMSLDIPLSRDLKERPMSDGTSTTKAAVRALALRLRRAIMTHAIQIRALQATIDRLQALHTERDQELETVHEACSPRHQYKALEGELAQMRTQLTALISFDSEIDRLKQMVADKDAQLMIMARAASSSSITNLLMGENDGATIAKLRRQLAFLKTAVSQSAIILPAAVRVPSSSSIGGPNNKPLRAFRIRSDPMTAPIPLEATIADELGTMVVEDSPASMSSAGTSSSLSSQPQAPSARMVQAMSFKSIAMSNGHGDDDGVSTPMRIFRIRPNALTAGTSTAASTDDLGMATIEDSPQTPARRLIESGAFQNSHVANGIVTPMRAFRIRADAQIAGMLSAAEMEELGVVLVDDSGESSPAVLSTAASPSSAQLTSAEKFQAAKERRRRIQALTIKPANMQEFVGQAIRVNASGADGLLSPGSLREATRTASFSPAMVDDPDIGPEVVYEWEDHTPITTPLPRSISTGNFSFMSALSDNRVTVRTRSDSDGSNTSGRSPAPLEAHLLRVDDDDSHGEGWNARLEHSAEFENVTVVKPQKWARIQRGGQRSPAAMMAGTSIVEGGDESSDMMVVMEEGSGDYHRHVVTGEMTTMTGMNGDATWQATASNRRGSMTAQSAEAFDIHWTEYDMEAVVEEQRLTPPESPRSVGNNAASLSSTSVKVTTGGNDNDTTTTIIPSPSSSNALHAKANRHNKVAAVAAVAALAKKRVAMQAKTIEQLMARVQSLESQLAMARDQIKPIPDTKNVAVGDDVPFTPFHDDSKEVMNGDESSPRKKVAPSSPSYDDHAQSAASPSYDDDSANNNNDGKYHQDDDEPSMASIHRHHDDPGHVDYDDDGRPIVIAAYSIPQYPSPQRGQMSGVTDIGTPSPSSRRSSRAGSANSSPKHHRTQSPASPRTVLWEPMAKTLPTGGITKSLPKVASAALVLLFQLFMFILLMVLAAALFAPDPCSRTITGGWEGGCRYANMET